jgi:lipoprotein-anchoring transpeptidase ErfK/SrfK
MSRKPLTGLVALVLACSALSACSGSATDSADPQAAGSEGVEQAAEQVDPLEITPSLRGAGVAVDKVLEVTARGGTLREVRVTSAGAQLPGKLSKDGSAWQATARLEPGRAYSVRSVGERSDGRKVVRTSSFRTQDLTLDEQTYASVAPLQGETVGVGMPVIVTFDVPVTDKASMEKNMHVASTPAQPGAWHWLSDYEAHWRPKSYWKAGTDVSVDLDINSVDAGAGIYGQENRAVDFSVGDANVYKVNAQTHQMQVFSNGELLRTIPITTGKAGFITRSGTKVIVEKFAEKRMNSETVGIGQDDPEYYNIGNVQYAMRLTYSGEFIHAAPWSVGSQGNANVSHGCTGMSTENAAWLYDMTRRGDVVEYTGTDRPMTLDNGYGDWNVDFATWKQGSALS